METTIKTPKTHPHHEVVGRFFDASGGVYYCDSYDPRCGFWMTNVHNPSDRRNVSERAIDATFHTIYEFRGAGHSRFRPHIPKEEMDNYRMAVERAGL